MTHMLIVSRDPDPELMPDAEIECHGVTDACAEWVECSRTFCSARATPEPGKDGRLVEAHGEEHRYFDEQDRPPFWGVRSGGCYAENRNDADAIEFAEEHQLGPGRYAVDVEVDGTTVIITPAEAQAALP